MTRSRTALSAAVLAAALSGCSSQATVKGTVRFDGQPVENGGITFIPAGAGGQKAGAEIRNGTYEIPRDRAPAPGRYKVEITWNKRTGKQVTVPGDPGNKIDETQQAIPAKYNRETTLTAELTSGSNTKDFDLSSR